MGAFVSRHTVSISQGRRQGGRHQPLPQVAAAAEHVPCAPRRQSRPAMSIGPGWPRGSIEEGSFRTFRGQPGPMSARIGARRSRGRPHRRPVVRQRCPALPQHPGRSRRAARAERDRAPQACIGNLGVGDLWRWRTRSTTSTPSGSWTPGGSGGLGRSQGGYISAFAARTRTASPRSASGRASRTGPPMPSPTTSRTSPGTSCSASCSGADRSALVVLHAVVVEVVEEGAQWGVHGCHV